MRIATLSAAILLAVPLRAAEKEEKPRSGCEKGEGVAAFQVKDITGPNSSKPQLCYV